MSARTNMRIALRPANGYRFQPTGFPDLGAATFKRPTGDGGWVEALHVESPQSMANRLEATTWDDASDDQFEALRGLPYVRIVDKDGRFITSSRQEAHRLASAYIMDGVIDGTPGRDGLPVLLGLKEVGGLDHRALAAGIARLDPLSLVHGVFFSQKNWSRQPKVARALTCFIDADGVETAISGGVKTDSAQVKAREGAGSKEGYGMVPHQRTEFTAQSITAYVSIDRAQVRSYGLGEEGTELVEALIHYELAHLFRESSLRLRTACDLEIADKDALAEVPTPEAADERVSAAIAAAGDLLGPVTEVVWASKATPKAGK